MPQVGAAYFAEGHYGLDIMIVVGENNMGGRPTLSFCMQYANENSVPPEKTYIDYGMQWGGWETMFTYLDPYVGADGSFALPMDAIMDGQSMEYVYNSGTVSPYYNPAATIDALMAD